MPTRTVQEIVEKSRPVIVDPDTRVIDVARQMVASGEEAALVVYNGKTIGIVTESDMVQRVIVSEKDSKTTPVSEIMTRETVIIRPERLYGQALYLMHEYDVRHIPVVDKGEPAGVVSASDALVPDLESYKHDVEMLDHIAEII